MLVLQVRRKSFADHRTLSFRNHRSEAGTQLFSRASSASALLTFRICLCGRVVLCIVGSLAAPLDAGNNPPHPDATTKNVAKPCQVSQGGLEWGGWGLWSKTLKVTVPETL